MPHSIDAANGRLVVASGDELVLLEFPKALQSVKVPSVPGSSAKDASQNYVEAVKFVGDLIVGIDHFGKGLLIYNLQLELVSQRVFPKRPSAFAVAGDQLFVGDKFGDVYQVPLNGKEPVVDAKGASLIEPVLGHVSMLLDVAVYNNSIISSDRDEHIRFSSVPHPYVIERFLFGHEQYVAHLEVIGDVLVSAGGDDFLCSWDLKKGEEIAQTDITKYGTAGEINVSVLAAYKSDLLFVVEGSTQLVRASLPDLQIKESYDIGAKIVDLAVDNEQVYVALSDRVLSTTLPWSTSPQTVTFEESKVPLLVQGQLRKQPEH